MELGRVVVDVQCGNQLNAHGCHGASDVLLRSLPKRGGPASIPVRLKVTDSWSPPENSRLAAFGSIFLVVSSILFPSQFLSHLSDILLC